MKKVFIITYYWPPAGGAGVQRTAKFCKYLNKYGWEPIILTVKNGNYPSMDLSLIDDVKDVGKVYRAVSWEPHIIYERLIGKFNKRSKPGRKSTQKTSTAGRFLNNFGEYIRLNLFIPDSRIGWLRNACRMAEKIIEKEKPSLLFTSAPPFTVLLIGLHVKRRFGLPWVTDFRDPWLENLHYNTVPRLSIVKRINRLLEQRVLQNADLITCVGEQLKRLLKSKLPHSSLNKFSIITNGYDETDVYKTIEHSDRFYLSYFGTIYPQRFPISLLHVLKGLIESNSDFAEKFSFRIIGHINSEIEHMLLKSLPKNNLSLNSYVPHQQLLSILYRPQVLVLTIDDVMMREHIITGKIFDYLPTGNPVLGIGPLDGDASKIIRETKTGIMFDYHDKKGIRQFIIDNYILWKENSLNTGIKEFPAFKRENLTCQLASLFDGLIK